jgi:hypothetical protein
MIVHINYNGNTIIEYDDMCDYQTYDYQKIFAKEMEKSLIKNGESIMNKETNDCVNTLYDAARWTTGVYWKASYPDSKNKVQDNFKNLKPNRIIYNGKTTICYFPDGDKVIVTCSDNEQQFEKEFGVMACIVKKLYGTRSEFLRVVEKGYTQPEPKKKEIVKKEIKPKTSKFQRLTKDG